MRSLYAKLGFGEAQYGSWENVPTLKPTLQGYKRRFGNSSRQADEGEVGEQPEEDVKI